jgi:hypothetical protein
MFYSLTDTCPACNIAHYKLLERRMILQDMYTLGRELIDENEDALGLRALGSSCRCTFCMRCLNDAGSFQMNTSFKITSCPRCNGDISMAIEYTTACQKYDSYIKEDNKEDWLKATNINKPKKKKAGSDIPPDPPLARPSTRGQQQRKK